jgi:hypothetical protein
MAKVIRILNGHRQMSNILTILVLVAVVLFSFTLDGLSTISTQNSTTDDVGNGGGTGIESISEQQLQQLKGDVKDKVGKALDKFNELIELAASFDGYASPESAHGQGAECRLIIRIAIMYIPRNKWAEAIGLEYNNDGNTDMTSNPDEAAYALVGDAELFHNATKHIVQIKEDYKNLTRRMYRGESDQELEARSAKLIATWDELLPLIEQADEVWENLVTAVNAHRAAVRQATGQ